MNEIDQMYPTLIRRVLTEGNKGASPRGMEIIELPNVMFRLNDARQSVIGNAARKLYHPYATIEMLGNLRHGKKNVEPFCWYTPNMAQYLNTETNEWDGSYATRIHLYDQMREMYKILKADPFSRRAVIAFYNPAHDFHDYTSRDICCTLSLVFSLRQGKLNLTCTMRSTDILLGLPYDLTQFTFLQSVLAAWLGVEVGWYCHFTANLHAYLKDVPKLAAIAEDADSSAAPLKIMPKWDIADPEETMAQVERFFKLDYEARVSNGKLTDSVIYGLYTRHDITSQTLKDLFEEVLAPAIRKKKAKLSK